MIVTILSERRRTVPRANMNDVARVAGVSLKTVSRVVNRKSGVHPSTARRVRLAIDQLGFRRDVGPHDAARGLSTETIAVVTEDTANPFYSTLICAVQEVAHEHDRQVLAASSDEDPERERELILDFCSRQVDGLVVVPAGGPHGYLVPQIRAGVKLVFVDRPAGDIAADTVLVDNVGGAAAAVRHLARYGHRRVAYFGDAPQQLVAMGPHDQGSVATALHHVLRRRTPATAVVTGNNRITVLVLRSLATWPDQPALVGFDDFELADLLEPKVSVIAHDVSALGKAAAELLFARLDGQGSPPHQLTLPVRLIARGSGEIRP